jgi:WD40 repeat protein
MDSERLTSVAFSPDARLLVTLDEEAVRVWKTATGRQVWTVSREGLFADAQFSPDGERLVTGSRDGIVRIWAARSGECLMEWSAHNRRIFTAEFSADGGYVLTASRDGTARVWDAARGECVATIEGRKKELNGAVLSPDGALVLTARRDGITRLWQSKGGALVGQLQGQTLDVHSWSFSGDGSLILTVARDGVPRVWEASSGRSLVELRGHWSDVVKERDKLRDEEEGDDDHDDEEGEEDSVSVRIARFSPDSRHVLTVGEDGSACTHECGECGTLDHLLTLAGQRVTRQLSPEERLQYLHEATDAPAAGSPPPGVSSDA